MKTELRLIFLLLMVGTGGVMAQDTWTQKANFPGGARYGAAGICIGDKCYAGLGLDDAGNYHQDFWEFDPGNNTWTRKADFPGGARVSATGFAIGNKGYIGTGSNTPGDVDWIWYNDLWEYDPATDTWTKKASFGETGRNNAVGFSIGNKGYIGTGTYRFDRFVDAIYLDDFWEYDPATNQWTQKASVPTEGRTSAFGMAIGNKGYVGAGVFYYDTRKEDFWEYDPATNTWRQEPYFHGGPGFGFSAFSANDKGYVTNGNNRGYLTALWEYNPAMSTWTAKNDFPGATRVSGMTFSTGSKGYIGLGANAASSLNDLWEYLPNPPVLAIDPVMVTTLAGSAEGYADGTGTAAQFSHPQGVGVDGAGNVYIPDTGNDRIRKITPAGVVTTFAGGVNGYADGIGTAARFSNPTALCFDASGNMYVADTGNGRIRKITPAGVVTTFAGSGDSGFADGMGPVAKFNLPLGIGADASGNVYVGDQDNHSIRKIDPTGLVSTIAGTGIVGYVDGPGPSAQFRYPRGIAVDNSGNIYVADALNVRIRKISPDGMVTTVAGTTQGYLDGPGTTTARFDLPWGLTVFSGNIYVADSRNFRIRKIDPTGLVTTAAGSGAQGNTDGASTVAQFAYPAGVAADASGNLYVADEVNHRIRKIGAPMFTSFSTLHGTPSAAQSFGVSGMYLPHSVVVTAPTGFEISLNASGGYASSLSLSPAFGTLPSQIVFLRLKADNPAGIYSGTINVSASGATTQTLAVSGTVICPDPEFSSPNQSLCFNPTNRYNLQPLTISDLCGTPQVTYRISGATRRSGTGVDASGFFKPGISTITWTIVSSTGKVFTLNTVITVQKEMTVRIPDRYAVNPGGMPNTIYLGYGASSLTFTAQVTGGEPYPGNTYHYAWSTGETSKSITVSPSLPGTYTYTVTVRDRMGCEKTASATVKVIDVRCGNRLTKIEVCIDSRHHHDKSVCVDKQAVPHLLRNGATLGNCACGPYNQENNRDELVVTEDTEDITAYPNPNTGSFTLQWINLNTPKARVQIIDPFGHEVMSQTVDTVDEVQQMRIAMPNPAHGLYLIRIVSETSIKTKKVIIK